MLIRFSVQSCKTHFVGLILKMLRFPERLALPFVPLPSLTPVTRNQESEPLGELHFILAGRQLMYVQLPWAIKFAEVFVSFDKMLEHLSRITLCL